MSRFLGQPVVAPASSRPRAGCQVAPSSVDTSTAATRPPSGIPRRTANRHFTGRDRRAVGRMLNRRGRGFGVAGGRRRFEVLLQRRRLRSHVRKKIHGGLPDVWVGTIQVDANPGGVVVGALRRHPGIVIVVRIQTPGPLHRTGAEHQRAAFMPIQGQVVGRRAGVVHRAMVLKVGQVVDGGLGETKQTGGTEAVVQVFVPLVSEQPLEQDRFLAGLEPGDCRVAPKPQGRVLGRHDEWVVTPGVDREDGPGERVFRLRPFRVEGSGIAPGPGPDLGERVDLGIGMGFFVGDQGAVNAAGAFDAGLPTRFPKDFVAAEKGQVDTGITRGFDVTPLVQRPVFVVTDRKKQPVPQDPLTTPVAVDSGEIADVVAIGLEEAHAGILGMEHGVDGAKMARIERTIVARLVRAGFVSQVAGVLESEAAVGAVSTITVVSLPGGIGGLEQDVGVAVVVAHDEVDMTGAGLAQRVRQSAVSQRAVSMWLRGRRLRGFIPAVVRTPAFACGILPDQPREINPGSRLQRRLPRCGDGPVAAVVEVRMRISQALGLPLRQVDGGLDGVDAARAHATVIAHAVNIDAVVVRVGFDLEVDRLATVDADVVTETLDRRITPAVDVPLGRGMTRQTVFPDDGVGGSGGAFFRFVTHEVLLAIKSGNGTRSSSPGKGNEPTALTSLEKETGNRFDGVIELIKSK